MKSTINGPIFIQGLNFINLWKMMSIKQLLISLHHRDAL